MKSDKRLKSEIYEERISRCDWIQLRYLYSQVVMKDTPDWEQGKLFEYMIMRAFELSGSEMKYPYSISIEGQEIEQIDGIVYVNEGTFFVECKSSGKLNIEPIAKLRNQILRRPLGTFGMLISLDGFTSPSLILSQYLIPPQLLLWYKQDIDFAIRKRDICWVLKEKYKALVEYGISDYTNFWRRS